MSAGSFALIAFADKVDVSDHLPLATQLSFGVLLALLAFFIVRPELWRRLFFDRVDPRPAALMRIGFGAVVLWTFLDLLQAHPPLRDSVARFLFTDEGIWLNDLARQNYGGRLRTMWDAEHGFEHWYDIFRVLWDNFTVLHLRSDPPFVFALYGLMCASLVSMIMGFKTRASTIVSWVLVETFYRYSPVFYTGGDTVVRVFLFLGMFARWGEAYSIDSWRRGRRAILSGAMLSMPPVRKIPAWPMRLMMLQLAIIYCATGLLKSGDTWRDGIALYYALNLDHFYRFPQTRIVTWLQYVGVLPAMSVFVRWWEVLFPIALIGSAVNAYEREREAGEWPRAALWRRLLGYLLFSAAWMFGAYLVGLGAYYYLPAEFARGIPRERMIVVFGGLSAGLLPALMSFYWLSRRFAPRVWRFVRLWIMGKRTWLVFGFAMHIGIDLGMNVGTFAEVMMAVYAVWLSGGELEAFWAFVFSRACRPGHGGRPIRRKRWLAIVLAPVDRLRFRVPGPTYVIHYHPDEASIRRAALLRLWDVGGRLEFRPDEHIERESLAVKVGGEPSVRVRGLAGAVLVRVFPGLWWLSPLSVLSPAAAGTIAAKVLHQRI